MEGLILDTESCIHKRVTHARRCAGKGRNEITAVNRAEGGISRVPLSSTENAAGSQLHLTAPSQEQR